MKIIPAEITAMTTALAGECPACGHWVGTIVKEYDSPAEAMTDADPPDIQCLPVVCCDPQKPVWPTHLLIIYGGQIVQKVEIGGDDLPVIRRELQ